MPDLTSLSAPLLIQTIQAAAQDTGRVSIQITDGTVIFGNSPRITDESIWDPEPIRLEGCQRCMTEDTGRFNRSEDFCDECFQQLADATLAREV